MAEGRILAPDFTDFRCFDSAMLFDGTQRIGGGYGSMLARVAGKNQASVLLLNETDQFAQLPPADLAGLVHHDNRL